ncbi:MAG: prephenate dehydrogenase/arogenate dehydrogenase family protein [Spirochaetales bacterium]|nr:prephenate dehydrogenase/arogenate dehydrogenase family protein [Spirochaetales bacterium]
MTIGIYGLGRFGSFWAENLAKHFSVKGYSRSSIRPVPPGVLRVEEDEIFTCDTLILCNSISSMPEVLARAADRLRPGTLVMDTCSVKMYPLQLMAQRLPETVYILGTHPMFGPDSAAGGLSGRPMILCPVRGTEELFQAWEDRFAALGLTIYRMTPEEHDREAAETQGITHFIGRVLDDLNLRPSDIATLGYTRLLQIRGQTCNDPLQLYLDLQRFNPYTGGIRARLRDAIEKEMKRLDAEYPSP